MLLLIIHAGASRVGRVLPLSEIFQTISEKTDANPKFDIQMFHDESWKPIYFGVKRSRVKVTRHKYKSMSVFKRNAISTLAA